MFLLNFEGLTYAKTESTSPLIFITGVRDLSSREEEIRIVLELKRLFDRAGFPFIYKMATPNTEAEAIRMERLRTIREHIHVPVAVQLSDTIQPERTAPFADVFMLEQGTAGMEEILAKVGRLGKPLILGKDLYTFSRDVSDLVTLAKNSGVEQFALCERGTSFGYDDLVVDMRSISIMQETAPVFFNASYSFSLPQVEAGFFDLSHKVSMSSVAFGAAALGLAGIIMDILPNEKLSDFRAHGMLTLGALPGFLKHIYEIDYYAKAVVPAFHSRNKEVL